MSKTKNKTVVVGLSGGVDSAVCALLLKEQGYDVIGIFMQNWEADRDDPYCTAEQDLSDAATVAKQIGIGFEVVNFSRAYWDRVFQHCLDEFHAGRTPNPDIWCNKEIKFKAFLAHAIKLGADHLATGHYARVKKTEDGFYLLKGVDPLKDQSYFLYGLNQYALSHTLFPLGALKKKDVRKIAENAGLINHNKKDSTGICFIGERDFKTFLKEYILAQPGDIQTLEGKVVGRHDGLMFYTLGQRKGLFIGGLTDASEAPWYIVDKDLKRNLLIIGQGHDHPRLFKETLTGSHCDWIIGHPPKAPFNCTARTRYHQTDQACRIDLANAESVSVSFNIPQRAITPGQSVVFYDNEICLGGAIINADL